MSAACGPVDLSATTESCSAPFDGQCNFAANVALPCDSAYAILLDDAGNDGTGAYTIHLEKLPPDYAIPSLAYGAGPLRLELGHRGDADWARFEGAVASDVRIAVNGVSNGLDPHVVVVAPDGSVLEDGGCTAPFGGTCTYVVDLLGLPLDGTYLVRVEDDDLWQLRSSGSTGSSQPFASASS